MRLLLLAALALGCAAAPQHQYERGTLTSPPPAALRPGVGLPQPGQPGAKADKPPRSTHGRVLPPTKEPGLWSAGSSDEDEESRVRIFDVAIPLPSFEEEEDGRNPVPVVVCADSVDDAAHSDPRIRRLVESAAAIDRACAAALAFLLCLDDPDLWTGRDEATRKGLAAAKRDATAFVDKACGAARPTAAQRIADLTTQARRAQGKGTIH